MTPVATSTAGKQVNVVAKNDSNGIAGKFVPARKMLAAA